MGFWSSVGSFFGGVARVLGGIGSSFIGVVSKIAEWCSSAKELKDAPRYDERNSSIDETLKMNELLERQRAGFSSTIKDLEKDFSNQTEEIFNELLKLSKEINEKHEASIHIEYLKNQFNDYIAKIEGSLANNVNQRIQISDTECSSLLKLEGTVREEKIDSYIRKIIKEGKDKYISELEYELKKTLELFEHAIKEKIDQKEKETNRLLADINNAKYVEDIEDKENKRKDLSTKNKDIEKNITSFEKKLELVKN